MKRTDFYAGRDLVRELLHAWPGPRCDATAGARLYLLYSCTACGAMIWPDDELARVQPEQIVCDGCRDPDGLTFIDGATLIETLRELVLAWPDAAPSATIAAARRYLTRHDEQ